MVGISDSEAASRYSIRGYGRYMMMMRNPVFVGLQVPIEYAGNWREHDIRDTTSLKEDSNGMADYGSRTLLWLSARSDEVCFLLFGLSSTSIAPAALL